MKRHISFLVCCLSGWLSLQAAAPPEIVLWPNGMPNPKVDPVPQEKTEKGGDGITRRWYVSKPRLIVHLPLSGAPRQESAIIVVPGGGFGRLSDEHEGSEVCAWFAARGLTAFQLAYRTPTTNHAEPNLGPAQDLQKAILEVRRRAAEFRVNTAQIGVLGFSAGGQVALAAATNPFPEAELPELKQVRPDFLILVYPYRIYDPTTQALRPDIRLDAGMPPTFIAQMGDDTGSVPEGSALLYLELIRRRIAAELHIYERGGHGFGMRSRPNSTGPADWPLRAWDWLSLRKLVKTAP